MTHDGTDLRIYFDGQKVAEVQKAIESATGGMILGAHKSTTQSYFEGAIDEASIYDRVLTAEEIDRQVRGLSLIDKTVSLYLYDADAIDRDGDSLTYYEQNLLAHWSMDDNAGVTATDDSINNNDATLAGDTTWTDGRYSNALVFDGVSGYAQTPAILDPATTSFTASVWLKLDQLPASGTSVILSQQDGTGTGRSWLTIDDDGSLQSWLGGTAIISSATVQADTWHHVAVTHDGTDLRIYFDGQKVAEVQKAIESATGDMILGAHKSTTQSFFEGVFDEVRIYDRALTDLEIEHWSVGLPPVIDPTTGEVTWTPSADLIGESVRVAIEVKDGNGGTDQQDYEIKVLEDPANHAPVIISTPVTTAGVDSDPNDTNYNYRYEVVAIDPDGDPVEIAFADTYTPPGDMALRVIDGKTFLEWSASNIDPVVELVARDNKGGSDSQSFTITVTPHAASITGTVWHDQNRSATRDLVENMGPDPVILFVIDTSGSTRDPFGGTPVGDLNGVNGPNDIIDAEIAAFLALNQSLIDIGLGSNASIGIIEFKNSASVLNLDPDNLTTRIFTSPDADTNNDQTLDIEEALTALSGSNGTNFVSPLVQAENILDDLELAENQGHLIFLSDGENGGLEEDEPAILELINLGINLRAFKVGISPGANQLGWIDNEPDNLAGDQDHAEIITSTDDLLEKLSDFTALGFDFAEPALEGEIVFIDGNLNGVRDDGERFATTDSSGNWTFHGLPVGTYEVVYERQQGWELTLPGSGDSYTVTIEVADNSSTIDEDDNGNALDFGTVEKQIAATNHTPVFAGSITEATIEAGQTYQFQDTATDQDDDALRYSLVAGPAGVVVSEQNGVLIWQTDAGDVGPNRVILSVTDSQAIDYHIINLNVTEPVTAPVIVGTPATKLDVDSAFMHRVLVEGTGLGDLTYSLKNVDSRASAMQIDSTGLITWDSTGTAATSGSPISYTVRVDDSSSGLWDEETYTLEIIDVVDNLPASITSTPSQYAIVGEAYSHTFTGSDPESEALTWRLSSYPEGMTLSEAGVLDWTPTFGQLGEQSFTVVVTDPYGAGQRITYTLHANHSNQAPLMNFAPQTRGYVGQTGYGFEVQVLDAEGTSPSLTVTAVDSNQAVVPGFAAQDNDGDGVWTVTGPTFVSGDIGTLTVTLTATDDAGLADTQSFDLLITATRSNEAPTLVDIDRTPGPDPFETGSDGFLILPVEADTTYTYTLAFDDPNGDTLALDFGTGTTAPIANDLANPGPGELGLLASGTTATVTWTPTTAQIAQSFVIEVVAVETLTGELYSLTVPLMTSVVAANSAPTLQPVASVQVAVGGELAIVLDADDAERDGLIFSLEQTVPGIGDDPAALGITVDQTGLISWSPQVGDEDSYSFTARVTDGLGGTNTQPVTVDVIADAAAPSVSVVTNNSSPLVGDTITLQVRAIDAAGVAWQWLTINGTTYEVNRDGLVSYTVPDTSTINIQGFAIDNNGQTGSSAVLDVFPYNEADQAPTLSITAPVSDQPVETPVEITGTIDDDSFPSSVYYRAQLIHANTGTTIELGTGETTSALAGGLGIEIDPRTFANGSYVLRLQASNATDLDNPGNHRIRQVDTWIDIDSGYLKLGNFELSFEDLATDVSGIPISITRTYDTLDANTVGDFGYGWTSEISTGALEVTNLGSDALFDDPFLGSSFAQPYQFGTRLAITLPGGQEMGFTAVPALFTNGSNQAAAGVVANGIELFGVVFQPDADSLGNILEFSSGSEIRLQPDHLEAFGFNYYDAIDVHSVEVYSDGAALRTSDDLPFSPVTVGWDFKLTTADGAVYTYSAKSGRLLHVVDSTGNRIDFDSSSNGETITSTDELGVVLGQIQITRDSQGRITQVRDLLDPTNDSIDYEYDAQGNLERVTDRSDRTTEFRYGENYNASAPQLVIPDHYLTTIVDGRDIEIAKVLFKEDGRLDAIVDASGQNAAFNYELDGTQFGLPSDHTVEVVTDAYGNTSEVVRDAVGNTLATVQQTYDDGATGALNTYLVTTYRYDSSDRQTHGSFQFTHTGEATRFSDPLDLPTDPNDQDYDPTVWASITAYDNEGNVTATTDAAGNTTYYANYDKYGNPRTITDTNGTTQSAFDTEGRLTQSTDALGNLTAYNYDASGNLTSLVQYDDADNAITVSQLAYDSRGRLVTTTDQSGVERHFIYDDANRQTHMWWVWTDPQGTQPTVTQVVETIYDNEGRTTASAQYTLTGALASSTAVLAALTSATADWSTSTAYDAAGNAVISTDQYGNSSYTLLDSRGSTVETRSQAKDDQGNPVWIVSRTAYDDNGRSVAYLDPFILTNADAPLTLDANGVAIANTAFDRANDAPVTAAADMRVSQTLYDALGRSTHSVRLEGLSIGIALDANGLPESTYTPVALANLDTDPAVQFYSQTVYDADGRVDYTISATGVVTESIYDAAGRQTQTIVNPAFFQSTSANPDYIASLETSTSTTAYDPSTGRALSSTDALTHTTHYQYDALGRLTGTRYHDDTTTATTYDYAGRRVAETDQLGRTTNYEYDDLGRLTAVILPNIDTTDPNSPRPRYEYAYDIYGNQTLIRDPEDDSHAGTINYTPASGDDKETTFTYDHRGRQIERELPNGLTESMVYDDTALADITGSLGSSVGMGQLEYTVDFEGRVTAYRYDNSALGRGRMVGTYYYDTLADYNNDPTLASPDRSVTPGYDAFGRALSVVDSGHGSGGSSGGGTTTNTFDIEGRLTQTITPEGILNDAYDDLGRKTRTWTSKTAAGTDAVTDTVYTYDELGRLASVDVVERADAAVTEDPTTYHYNAVGSLDAIEQSNGVVADYVYDSLNRLIHLYHFEDLGGDAIAYDAGVDTLIASFDYTLDAAGNRVAASESVDGQTYDWLWAYDGLNRLSSEQLDASDDSLDYTDRFTFDHASNRTRVTRDEGSDGSIDKTTTYQYDANDRLVIEQESADGVTIDQTTAYAYGTGASYTGNLDGGDSTTQTEKVTRIGTATSGVNFISRVTFAYDAMGRMVQTQTFSNGATDAESTTTYTYNASGLRVAESDGTDTKEYLFDAMNPTGYAQVLEEYVNDVLEKTYTLGHDVINQHDTTNGVLTMLYDGHGSTRALLTAALAVLEAYAYDAYGNMLEGTSLTTASAALTSILYSGEWTQSNGTQYLRARFYDPSSGRFNRLDPYAGNTSDPLSLHKYLYTHGNPVMGIDPSGEVTLKTTIARIGLHGTLLATTFATISFTFSKIRGLSTSAALYNAMLAGGIGFAFAIPGVNVALSTVFTGLIAWEAVNGNLDGLDIAELAVYIVAARFISKGVLPRIDSGLGGRAVSSSFTRSSNVRALSQLRPGADGRPVGLSAVWDPVTGETVAWPSGQTVLSNGQSPTGRLPSALGHGQLNSLWFGTRGGDIPVSGRTWGYTIIDQGRHLEIRWNSGSVNFVNHSRQDVPVEFRARIMEAVRNMTGREVRDGAN